MFENSKRISDTNTSGGGANPTNPDSLNQKIILSKPTTITMISLNIEGLISKDKEEIVAELCKKIVTYFAYKTRRGKSLKLGQKL